MTTTQTVATSDFVISRVFDAPRDLVWKCFTDPEHMQHWWGPKGVAVVASWAKAAPARARANDIGTTVRMFIASTPLVNGADCKHKGAGAGITSPSRFRVVVPENEKAALRRLSNRESNLRISAGAP